MSIARDLMRLNPISVDTEAPPLSLTADEGTWVKLRDFKGQMAVVLLFFKSEANDTVAWLKAWSEAKDSAEKLDAVIFGAVNEINVSGSRHRVLSGGRPISTSQPDGTSTLTMGVLCSKTSSDKILSNGDRTPFPPLNENPKIQSKTTSKEDSIISWSGIVSMMVLLQSLHCATMFKNIGLEFNFGINMVTSLYLN